MSDTPFIQDTYYYTYAAHPPALRIEPGQQVDTICLDSSNGDKDGNELPRERRQQGEGLLEYNAVTGPFHVEGAEVGDTLVVHLDAVEPDRPSGFGAVHSHLSALGDDIQFFGPTGLKLPISGRRYDWDLDLERNVGRLALPDSRIGEVEIPLHTFLGCIGVAPRFGEAIHTVDAGRHGGNLDCPEVCSGVDVHLPVNVPRGLLMFGDPHAAQGDGEIAGGAIETSARVRFSCEVIKGRGLGWPRIVNDKWIMTVASARPLDTVLRIGWVCMVKWLEREYGYEMRDAIQVLSQVGRARVCNAVSPHYTAVVKFPRRYLP